MNVFFHSELFVNIENDVAMLSENMEIIHALVAISSVRLWIAPSTYASINVLMANLHEENNGENFLNIIFDHFSTIPLQKATIHEAIGRSAEEFDSIVQLCSAEQFNMDCIIRRDNKSIPECRLPIIPLKEIELKIEEGYFNPPPVVPFIDLKAQLHQVYNEIGDRFSDIIGNTGFILGPHVIEFEERFSKMQGVKHCIGVSSGTDALHIALLTLGVGPGGTVLLPVNTFIATAEAVSLAGATPVFMDCDAFFNLDTQALKTYLDECRQSGKPLPSAVIPVHLYGQSADMTTIMKLSQEFDIPVVEDCCQAHLAGWHGKKVGNFGKFGAFSFYPGKNLGAFGEAGALVTNDEFLYEKAVMIRQHGETKRYHHDLIGHNYRMEAIQGAVLSVKLNYLAGWTTQRRKNATLYSELLETIDQVKTPKEREGTNCAYHLYVILAKDRDNLKTFLEKSNISTGLHYPVPLHLQAAYEDLGYVKGDFPMAEMAASCMLSLPMYPELAEQQIEYVCDKIKEFYNKR